MHSFIKELNEKNLIENITNIDKIEKSIEQNKGIYIGFDPTAKSIHLGNFVVLNVLLIAQKHNIPIVALIGGATGGIGDPSGKNSERILLDEKTLLKNTKAIERQIKYFLPKAKIINNSDFYEDQSFIDFLRETGKYIQIPYMLGKEIVKNRLESGISFTEFSYSLIQANDFYNLFHNHNVGIQIGGSDQWGNITTGLELIRKKDGENFNGGITIKLLLKSDGTKFGKSEGGAIFLDPELTTPYDMYQFIINQNDDDLLNLFNFLSSFEAPEIKKIISEHQKNPKLKYGQNLLAENIIERIHSKKTLNEVKNISNILFVSNDFKSLNKNEVIMIQKSLEKYHYNFNLDQNIIDLLFEAGLYKSKTEIRKLISQKGLIVGNERILDHEVKLKEENITHESLIVKQGKRKIYIISNKK